MHPDGLIVISSHINQLFGPISNGRFCYIKWVSNMTRALTVLFIDNTASNETAILF